jgi:hypothetical protein
MRCLAPASGRSDFTNLRHTFGTRMIAKADIRRVQEWMGHADIQTTMRYLHYAPHAEDAALVAEAFRVEGLDGGHLWTSRDIWGQLRRHPGTSRLFRARSGGNAQHLARRRRSPEP